MPTKYGALYINKGIAGGLSRTNLKKIRSKARYSATCTIHAYIEFYSMHDRIGLKYINHLVFY